MPTTILGRIPVVGGLAYIEQVRRLPSPFVATLTVEPDHRYFPQAIAVLAGGDKVGYVAPEIARGFYDALKNHTGAVTCPGRRSTHADHETSGVELLLDFSALPITAG